MITSLLRKLRSFPGAARPRGNMLLSRLARDRAAPASHHGEPPHANAPAGRGRYRRLEHPRRPRGRRVLPLLGRYGPCEREDRVAQPKAPRTWGHGSGSLGGHGRGACVHPGACANAVEAGRGRRERGDLGGRQPATGALRRPPSSCAMATGWASSAHWSWAISPCSAPSRWRTWTWWSCRKRAKSSSTRKARTSRRPWRSRCSDGQSRDRIDSCFRSVGTFCGLTGGTEPPQCANHETACPCLGGEIGRRARLKIWYGQPCESSSLSPGTNRPNASTFRVAVSCGGPEPLDLFLSGPRPSL